MAEVVGQNGLHNVRGFLCDLCGRDCDPEAQELNALDCTFANCPKSSAVYHQDCLEKYLKSVRLEKSRKTGFRCPRGTGKGTKFADQPCPGKIDKSHPIHIRNDNAKKRRKAQMPAQIPEPRPKLDPKDKAKIKEEEAKKMKERKAKEDAAKAGKAGAAKLAKALSKEEQARQEKLRMQAVAQALRRDMGLTTEAPGSSKPVTSARPAPVGREIQTLDEYEAARTGGSKQVTPLSNAWSAPKSRKPALDTSSTPLVTHRPQPSPGWAAATIPPGPPPPPPARKIPSSSRLSGPALKLTSQGGEDKAKGLPVGMESASPPTEDGPKLTKAQRKNLRRAEKKAAERNQEKLSVASSELVSEMDMTSFEGDAFNEIPVIEEEEETIYTHMHDDCAQALTLFKAQALIRQLQTLGFPDWQCVPAIMRHGSNLEEAVAFLLEGHIESEQHAQELLNDASDLPYIDITPEMTRVQELKDELHLDLDLLQDAVVRHQGNLNAACNAIFEDNLSSPGESSSPGDNQQPQNWQTAEDEAYGSVQSDLTNLVLDQGEQWTEAAPSNGIYGSKEPSSQTGLLPTIRSNTNPSLSENFFPDGAATWSTAAHYPEYSHIGSNFNAPYQPPTSRPTSSIERYNELLALTPSAVDHQASLRDQGSSTEIYPQQRQPSSSAPTSHVQQIYPTWDLGGTGGNGQQQLDAPEAALYAAAAVTDAKKPAAQEQPDLDIDNLLASLIAQ